MARKSTDTVQLKLRFSEGLRRQLEKQAERNIHSMNTEIIHRLETSLEHEKALGGAEAVAIFHLLAGRIAAMKAKLGPDWQNDTEKALVLTRGLCDAIAQALPNIQWVRVATGSGDDASYFTSYATEEAMLKDQQKETE